MSDLPEARQCDTEDDRFNPRGSVAVAASLPDYQWLVARPGGGSHWVPPKTPEAEAIAGWALLKLVATKSEA